MNRATAKIAFSILLNHMTRSFIVIFQMICVFLLGAYTVTNFTTYSFSSNIFEDFTDKNVIYFNPIDAPGFDGDITMMPEYAEIKEYIGSVSYAPQYFCRLSSSEVSFNIVGVYTFNDDMANNLTFALKRGKQLSVAQREEGVINALASNPKVKPGRVYDVSISGYSEKLKIKIIGIVTESAYNISLNSGGDVINSTDIFPTVSQMAKSKCDCLLWFSYDDLPASFAENIRRDSNAFVFPKEGITPQQLSFLEDTLNGMGNAHTREDILGFDSEAREYLLKQYIPMFVFLLIITLSGILSAVLVSLRVSLKDYAVYYACGADKRTILYANVLYALVLCAAAALPCSALFILSKYITLSVFGYISTNSYTFLFMLITALLVGAATCIAVMLSLKRLSIRKILCSGE